MLTQLQVPAPYVKKDTLNEHEISASGLYGSLRILKVNQPQVIIHDEAGLIEFYKVYKINSYINGAIKFVSTDSMRKVNELTALAFQVEMDWNGLPALQDNILLTVDGSMYWFMYGYYKDQEEANIVAEERERFFGSITFSNVDLDNQLTKESQYEKNYQTGATAGLYLRYLLLALVGIALILLALKKYYYLDKIKKYTSLGLLSLGATFLFIYLVNRILNPNYPDELLHGGGFWFVVGFVLRFIKVPLPK